MSASYGAERQQLLRDVAVGIAASVQQMTQLNANLEAMLAQSDAIDAHANNWLRLVDAATCATTTMTTTTTTTTTTTEGE
jgi:hypothetical protein